MNADGAAVRFEQSARFRQNHATGEWPRDDERRWVAGAVQVAARIRQMRATFTRAFAGPAQMKPFVGPGAAIGHSLDGAHGVSFGDRC